MNKRHHFRYSCRYFLLPRSLNLKFEMAVTCNKCKAEIKGPYIQCGGFCDQKCHQECSGLPIDFAAYGICWMCTPCKELINNSSIKKFIAAQEDVLSVVKAQVESSVKKISDQVQGNSKKIEEILGILSEERQTSQQKFKRTRDIFEAQQEQQSFFGAKTENEFGIVTVAPPAPKKPRFWLYLTRLDPSTTEKTITEMTSTYLQTKDVIVKQLIPKARIESKLAITFSSFKIGIDKSLKNKALNPSIWPKGVQYREFIDYKSGNSKSEPEPKNTAFLMKSSTLDSWIDRNKTPTFSKSTQLTPTHSQSQLRQTTAM